MNPRETTVNTDYYTMAYIYIAPTNHMICNNYTVISYHFFGIIKHCNFKPYQYLA